MMFFGLSPVPPSVSRLCHMGRVPVIVHSPYCRALCFGDRDESYLSGLSSPSLTDIQGTVLTTSLVRTRVHSSSDGVFP